MAKKVKPPPPDHKRCTTCKKVKRNGAFSIHRPHFGEHWPECDRCFNAYWAGEEKKKRRRAGAKKRIAQYQRKHNLKKKYGLTLEAYEALLAEQKKRCAICRLPLRRPHVDHKHKTKKARGLLCHGCNVGLGHFKENVKYLLSAVEYLKKHNNVHNQE